MSILEQINATLKAKNMTKRELANRIIALEYRAAKTSEIPSESSIYAYLNGSIELKADLLPYIAEALNIYEQELFSSESKSKKILQKLYRNDIEKYAEIIDLLEYVSPKTIETLKSILQKAKTDNQSLNAMLKGYLKNGGIVKFLTPPLRRGTKGGGFNTQNNTQFSHLDCHESLRDSRNDKNLWIASPLLSQRLAMTGIFYFRFAPK